MSPINERANSIYQQSPNDLKNLLPMPENFQKSAKLIEA